MKNPLFNSSYDSNIRTSILFCDQLIVSVVFFYSINIFGLQKPCWIITLYDLKSLKRQPKMTWTHSVFALLPALNIISSLYISLLHFLNHLRHRLRGTSAETIEQDQVLDL